MQEIHARCEREISLWESRYNVATICQLARGRRYGMIITLPLTGVTKVYPDMFDDIADLSDSTGNYTLTVNGNGNVDVQVALRRHRSQSPGRTKADVAVNYERWLPLCAAAPTLLAIVLLCRLTTGQDFLSTDWEYHKWITSLQASWAGVLSPLNLTRWT